MIRDNLFTGEEVRSKLMAGIHKVAMAVGSTMGTGGSNAIIEAIEYPGHMMTNDGFSIANSVILADPIEEIGRKILVETINRANKQSGDGSSTTAVLTDAIMSEGMKQKDVHPMELKRSLEECVPIIESAIKAQTREITTADVGKVASVSAEDEGIGARIQEIYEQIGKTGIIHWDISKTAEDSYTIGTGITVEGAGFFSPYMCDATESGQSTNRIRIQDPYILLTKQKIASASDFNEIAAALNNKVVKDLVVFCDDIEPLVIPDIIKTRAMRGFRIAIVKMPVLWKDWWFEDLSHATGAKIADPTAGLPLRAIKIEMLGRASNILITKDDTYVDGIKDMTAHIESMIAEGTDEGALRASRLNTKTARYFVGAQSDSALSYRRLKVEDAISAAWQALNGGIVAGGGVALKNVAKQMPETVGGSILKTALLSPMMTIGRNAGQIDTVEYVMSFKDNTGYDTKRRGTFDMYDAGIIDPANVVLNAVKNAVSVSASILTATTIVTLPRMEVDPSPLQQPTLAR